MPRAFWDWGVNPNQVTLSPEFTPAELAARLGMLPSIDRTGEVIAASSFESGMQQFATTALGTGASVRLSNTRARTGAFSILLTNGSTGAREASLRRELPFQTLSRYGFEVAFSIAASIGTLDLRFERFTGSEQHLWIVRFDDDNNRLQVLNSSGSFVTFATGIDLFIEPRLFHSAKLVVDFTTEAYVRFRFGQTTHDLSAQSASVTVNAALPFVRNQLLLQAGPAGNNQVFTDDWLHTHNEP